MPVKKKPWLTIPNIKAPNSAPTTVPYPPVRNVPPITAAMIASNSFNWPRPASAEPKSKTCEAPNTAAQKAENMNSVILTLLTGTPSERAALSSPPDAMIQLPKRVLERANDAAAPRPTHPTTIHRTPAPLGDPPAIRSLAAPPPRLPELAQQPPP